MLLLTHPILEVLLFMPDLILVRIVIGSGPVRVSYVIEYPNHCQSDSDPMTMRRLDLFTMRIACKIEGFQRL